MPSEVLVAATAPSVDLRSEPDLLGRFERDIELAGLVGEKKNAKVVLLAAVSAKLSKPLNVSVGGSSAAGKNHLIGTVARFIPDEGKKVVTGMSPKALMHSEENEFQHKAVFIAEYEGVSGADYPIRTFQSEQKIEWEFVDSSGKDGLKKKRKTVLGPAAFIQATTRVTLHPENETRLLFIQMDESEAQTRAIKERQALEAEKKATVCPPDVCARWHDLHRSLEQKPVRIPFVARVNPCVRTRPCILYHQNQTFASITCLSEHFSKSDPGDLAVPSRSQFRSYGEVTCAPLLGLGRDCLRKIAITLITERF